MNAIATVEQEELIQLLIEIGNEDRRAFAELYKRTSSKFFGTGRAHAP